MKSKKLTSREIWKTVAVTAVFAAIGALLGAVAYYQKWLG